MRCILRLCAAIRCGISILLLGVGHGNNTSFHLAEYRVPFRRIVVQGAAVLEEGRATWRTYHDVEVNADLFPAIGAAYEVGRAVRIGLVGSAESRLFAQRPAVDFAQEWLTFVWQ